MISFLLSTKSGEVLLKFGKKINNWFAGTIPLLVGRHYQWFKDNKDSYDKKFIEYVEKKLNKR